MKHNNLRYYKIVLYITMIVAIIPTITSCNNLEEEYSSEYECLFVFDTTRYPTSLIALSLVSPGMFVTVDISPSYGLHKLDISSNITDSIESITLQTEVENKQIGSVGANESLIIGTTSLNELRAYDRQCPNCLNDYSGRNFPLTWTSDNKFAVKCNKCNRIYELNYDGCSNDNSSNLLKYRISYVNNTLRVTN